MSAFQGQQQGVLRGGSGTIASTPLHQRCDDDVQEAASGIEPPMHVLLTPHGPSLHLPEALFTEGDEWLIRQRQAAAAATSCSSADPRGYGSSQPSSDGIQRDNVNAPGAGLASSAPLSDLDHWFQQQHLLRYGPDVPFPKESLQPSGTSYHPQYEYQHQRSLDAEQRYQQARQIEALRQSPESMAQLAAMVNLQVQQASMFSDSSQEDAQRDKLALLAALQKWQVHV